MGICCCSAPPSASRALSSAESELVPRDPEGCDQGFPVGLRQKHGKYVKIHHLDPFNVVIVVGKSWFDIRYLIEMFVGMRYRGPFSTRGIVVFVGPSHLSLPQAES